MLIGAGGIANDAHLPAYRLAALPVAGVFDVELGRARETAQRWDIPRVFESLAQAAACRDCVFDVAVPPRELRAILTTLPDGACVLIQKPLGENLVQASELRALARRRRLIAAVNFQLRFSPLMLALSDAVARGLFGRIVDVDVHVVCHTPWERWPFLRELERVEIALHSIHYLDAIRALLGEPRRVFARTVRHPRAPELASTRTSAILDYGDDVRCALSINHHHVHGPRHEQSTLRVEGLRGAAVATLGVNLDYPRGRPDALELAFEGESEWRDVKLAGNWFPQAFAGTMSNLQRFAAGEDDVLVTSIDDAWRTMALVEALYESDAHGGTPLPRESAS